MKNALLRAPLAVLPLAILAGFPLGSHAQSAGLLNETVVTATRNPSLLSATMAHTTVISRQDIEQSQVSDLLTLLQREAGLQRTQAGGIGSVSSIFVRGAPSNQTLVLVDGIALNKQDASGAVSLEHLMLDNVERVEIVRGNVSAIYGSGAVGGVIQVFTRQAAREPSALVSAELGPRETAKLSSQVSARVGQTSIGLGASRYVTHGFSAINTEQLPGANPDKDGYQNTSLNFSLVHDLDRQHRIGMRFLRSNGASQYDNAFGVPTDVQESETRLRQASLFSDNTWGAWRSRVTLTEQADQSVFGDNGAYGSNDRFRTEATVLNWVNNYALGGDWMVTAGIDHQRQRVLTGSDVYATYNVRRNATAVFAGVEGDVGPGALQVNLRHDRIGGLNRDTRFLGYGLPLGESLKLVASVSTAFNAPPLGYLYAPSYGNAALKPEEARSQEIGFQYTQQNHFLRATWFNTRVTNEFDFGAKTFVNIGRTRNQGLEVSYRGSLGQTGLRASLTVQDPKNAATGQALQRRAKTLVSVGASQSFGAVMVDADWRHSGQRPDRYTDASTWATVRTSLPAYAVLDLAASYPLNKRVVLRGRIDNVTDKAYQTVYGYNQQPRSLYVGLSWQPSL